jgi:putative sigma-54 modulation protein
MQLSFTYKHIKSSPEVNAYAKKKISKLDKYKDFKLIEGKFVFTTAKDDSIHIAELIVQIKNDIVSATVEASSMYQAIDGVIAKVGKQLMKKKTNYIKSRQIKDKHNAEEIIVEDQDPE